MHQKSRLLDQRALWIMLLPVIIYFVIFKYMPLSGIIIAFKRFSSFKGILESPFVGLLYFKQFFTSIYFTRVLGNTLIIGLFYLVFAFPAPIGLYYGIHRWNGYFWAMVFLKDPDKFPLQVILRQLVVVAQMGEEMDAIMDKANTTAVSIQYATIVIATLPMPVIYPYIQKYFVKSVTLGSMKG